jgi:hypothetical protein
MSGADRLPGVVLDAFAGCAAELDVCAERQYANGNWKTAPETLRRAAQLRRVRTWAGVERLRSGRAFDEAAHAACVALGVKNRSTVLGLIESGVPCAAAFALVD